MDVLAMMEGVVLSKCRRGCEAELDDVLQRVRVEEEAWAFREVSRLARQALELQLGWCLQSFQFPRIDSWVNGPVVQCPCGPAPVVFVAKRLSTPRKTVGR